jgi:antitoxin CcdA
VSHLSLGGKLVSQARNLNINLSRAAEEGIERAVKAGRERLWRLENAEAIRQEAEYVESMDCRWRSIANSDGALPCLPAEIGRLSRH